MPVQNSDVANILDQVGDLLEIEGANPFRIRAYHNAARIIGDFPENVAEMVEQGEDLTDLPGIGKDLATKIQEIVHTGDLEQLEELREQTPPALAKMLTIPGLGPKRVQTIHRELGVTTLDELRKAAEEGKIRELSGFGAKTEQKILDELKREHWEQERVRLNVAEQFATSLTQYLQRIDQVGRVEVAGSYRRRKETVGDLDILATGKNGPEIMDHFIAYDGVSEVISRGDTRSTVVLRQGLQVDLRVVAPESYGAALLYFTGSKAHNIVLRNMALDRGLKINEYGVFRGEKPIAGATEDEIYGLLGLPWIPPELREDRGEIQAAEEGKLPALIELADLRGDLQVHTTASDGRATLEEMSRAARERGYEYLAITDHSPHIAVAHGLDAEALAERIREIDRLNERLDGIRILKGVEVDILEDGSLDLPDSILKELDLTICAVHSHFGLSTEQQTERIIRAMDNPYFNILAHPSGRLIGRREPYSVDMERVIQAALVRGCHLEVNGHPERMDLDDIHCKMAKQMGLKLVISTDAHSVAELDYLRFGVGQARRGWLEAEDVLNTKPWNELSRLLQRT